MTGRTRTLTSNSDTLPLAGCKILVVEDEFFFADDLCRALTAAGAAILGPINDAKDALRLVQDQPDLQGAILDINVRGTVIYGVADELTRRGVPFVFATGYDRATVPTLYGHVPRWEKPFDPAALVQSLPAIMRCDRRASADQGTG